MIQKKYESYYSYLFGTPVLTAFLSIKALTDMLNETKQRALNQNASEYFLLRRDYGNG